MIILNNYIKEDSVHLNCYMKQDWIFRNKYPHNSYISNTQPRFEVILEILKKQDARIGELELLLSKF